MPIKELFETIRKEDVCLWIGSGFSVYAGYPSVADIKALLSLAVSKSDRKLLDQNKSLRDFTTDFALLKSRAELIGLLQKSFQITEKSTYYHQLLSKIAHIKTIITTNYDTLIEDAYTKKAITIRRSQDVPLISSDLVKIFKIHGDIAYPETIVITREDYSQFNNPAPKDIFWSAVRNEIATKHILFLGYGYEDENIWAEFQTLYQQTSPNRKKRYLVGRPMGPLKHKMLEDMQIEFIEASYEHFLPELIEHLKLHLPGDLRNKVVSTHTASQFLSSFDLNFQIEDTSGNPLLLYVNKKDGAFEPKMNFTTTDKASTTALKKLMNREVLNVTLDAKQLGNFSLISEGFGLMNQNDIGKLELMSLPVLKGSCSLVFPEKDFELEGGKYQVYGTTTNFTIKGQIKGFKIEITIAHKGGDEGFRFHITEPEQPSSLSDLRGIFQVLLYLAEHERIHIHLDNGKVVKQQFASFPQLNDYQMRMQVFDAMKKIERTFQVRFPKFKIHDINNADVDLMLKLISLIENGYYAVNQKETMMLDVPMDEELVKVMNDMPQGAEIFWQRIENYVPEILGVKLDCGKEQLTMINPKLLRLDLEKGVAVFNIHQDLAVYRYERFGLKKPPTRETIWSLPDSNSTEGSD